MLCKEVAYLASLGLLRKRLTERMTHDEWVLLGAKVSFFASVAVCLVIVLLGYYVVIYENPPVIWDNDPFPTTQEVYAPGELVYVSVEGNRRTNRPFELSYQLTGENTGVDTLPSQLRGGLPKGPIPMTKIALTRLPVDAPPDTYTICAKATYDYRLFTRVVPWCTQPFKIELPAPNRAG